MQELDKVDQQILNQLCKNNRVTAEELGVLVNLSTSAVQRRVQRLRQDKIIEADVSVVSPEALGYAVTCIVDVALHLGNSEVIDAFKSLLADCPEVIHGYYVAGTYDFVIIVVTKNIKHYEEFSKTHLMDNPAVKQFYTHVVMDKLKTGFSSQIMAMPI